eukprot:4581450-Lingulodinium_polyedra.AAC.1
MLRDPRRDPVHGLWVLEGGAPVVHCVPGRVKVSRGIPPAGIAAPSPSTDRPSQQCHGRGSVCAASWAAS